MTRASRPRRTSATGWSQTPRSSSRSSTGSWRRTRGQVESYRGGKEGLLGFFVGQVMRETQGKADPKVVNQLLREKLSA